MVQAGLVLPPELLLQVIDYLEDISDLLACNQVSRELYRLSVGQLYAHPQVTTSTTAPALIKTLTAVPQLRSLVRRVDLLRPSLQALPRDPSYVALCLAELLTLTVPTLLGLGLDVTDLVWVVPLLDSLAPLGSPADLRQFQISGAPWSLPLAALLPCLAHFPQLQELSVAGLVGISTVIKTDVTFHHLQSLSLFLPILDGEAQTDLINRIPPGLRKLDLTLLPFDDPFVPSPSDETVLGLIRVHGQSLESISIIRFWTGSIGGNPNFGRQLLELCGDSLRYLKLEGEIFDKRFLQVDNPAAKNVRKLELEWCATIDYADIAEAIGGEWWSNLKEIKAHSTGYDEDFGMDTVGQLAEVLRRRQIIGDIGARQG